MKVFLTGGTGFIGQPLTKALLARGWSVTALVRKPNTLQAQGLSKIGAQLSTGDVTERESMRAAMNDADIVVHNAGHYEYGVDKAGKQRMHAINVTGTDNVLRVAHELGIQRTVYVSTVQAFGETGPKPRDETFKRYAPCRTTYEQSKTDAHEIALQHQQRGLPLVIVCPHAVIGANDHSSWGYFSRLECRYRLLQHCQCGWRGRNLTDCCRDYEFDQRRRHALADARAAARVLTDLLSGEPRTVQKLRQLTPIQWRTVPIIGKQPVPRDESCRRQTECPHSYNVLSDERMTTPCRSPPTAEYGFGALLDWVLEDRHVDDSEADALVETAARWGPSRSNELAHRAINELDIDAAADGIVTDVERSV